MRLHRETWLAVLLLSAVLVAANFWCWRPGIGGSHPSKPPGTELELYYGWPATYQAEWWRSEDAALGMRLLESAPFFTRPAEMSLQTRYVSMVAVLANLAFAGAGLFAVGARLEGAARKKWSAREEACVSVAVLIMLAVLAVSGTISQHL